MNHSPSTLHPFPPQLTMDEYADFIETSIQTVNPVHAARQKELEERIDTPFCLVHRTVQPPALTDLP